ncbi:uncharacterized protein LOC122130519 isoform X2 [Clupea harengus]|uniref:Uncharacterized protein LOC122130519 isoform X2 n=1 Tax=Clupea harengus TaxID=7950 RepID=A0A8M1KH66_CLUHA|nr:uncharacterized protein LOC122130519 isoform X2 [Clupea harengus]
MSGGRKPRSVANPLESAITTPSERILKQCHNLYIDNDNGLVKIAGGLGLLLLPPRKKIIVMIMGNHSAGKSSFINWYVEEHIQKTGVAIETQGFTFITSGRKRESLTGNATLHLYPHFRPLLEFKGVTDYLSAEISTSKQKKFSLVTFVDTPGLVDGDMIYPFEVNNAITSFGTVQANAQHSGETERDVRRQASLLPQQGGRGRQGDGPTESDDADCSGAVSPPRAQPVWLCDAHYLHPQSAEGEATAGQHLLTALTWQGE